MHLRSTAEPVVHSRPVQRITPSKDEGYGAEPRRPVPGPAKEKVLVKQIDVVGAVIRNQVGEVLCARRPLDKSQGGLWEFPGGKVEPGESQAESLQREIREELGCEIVVGQQIADVTYTYPNQVVRLTTYRARLLHGEPTPKEHLELRWLPVNQLGTLEWSPADLPTVRRLQRER